MDWEAVRDLYEKLAGASRDAADSAPHGSIYHLEAAKFLAMCQALEEYSHEKEAAAAAPAPDAVETEAGGGEAAAPAEGQTETDPAETDTDTPKTGQRSPRGRRK